MKVIFLMAPGPFGGAEKVVSSGLTELSKTNSDCELWIIQESRDPTLATKLAESVPASILKKTFVVESAISLSLFKQLKTALSQIQSPAILHTHGFKAGVYAFIANSKLNQIHTHHGNTSHTFKVRVYETLELWMMKRVRQVHAVSSEMYRQLSAKGIKNLVLIKNPLTLTPIELNPNPSNKTFVFVGRLSPEKGASVLIEAFSQIKTKDVQLVIVGDGVEREKLRSMASKAVLFAGFQKDVTSFLAKADALIMPSLREGLPLTLIEATAMGLPIIASNVGGIPELVQDQSNGILLPAGDATKLAQAIDQFCEKAEYFKGQASLKKDIVKNEYSLANWAKNTLARYRELAQ